MNKGKTTSTVSIDNQIYLAADYEDEYQKAEKPLAIAEAFVKFAKERGFNFWI